jgi:hypothetical protein
MLNYAQLLEKCGQCDSKYHQSDIHKHGQSVDGNANHREATVFLFALFGTAQKCNQSKYDSDRANNKCENTTTERGKERYHTQADGNPTHCFHIWTGGCVVWLWLTPRVGGGRCVHARRIGGIPSNRLLGRWLLVRWLLVLIVGWWIVQQFTL